MADLRTFRNRLKLPAAPARGIAIMDLRRVPVEERDGATGVLIDHLAREPDAANRLRIFETLLDWQRRDACDAVRPFLSDADPAIADAAKVVLKELGS